MIEENSAIMSNIVPLILLALSWRSNAKPFRSCQYPSSVCGDRTLNQADSAVLLSFKSKSKSSLRIDWNPSFTCSQGWTGVCTDSSGRVTELYLSGSFQYPGAEDDEDAIPMPSAFGNLTKLLYLDVSKNLFKNIPSSFSLLTNLLYLDLNWNKLGVFNGDPGFDNIGSLSKLTYLSLSFNSLGYSVYKTILKLTNLKSLYVNVSYITGLPSDIGKLSKLETLAASGIALHAIPLSLTTIPTLVNLDISGNFLNETALPIMAKMKQLKYLDLSNSLLYSFPRASLDSLTNLVFLNLSRNQYMTGENIPSLDTLKSLEHLDLSNCNFGGVIPSSFGTFRRLKTLYLNKNRLCGGIPSFLESLPLLTKLDLSDNFLTGSVPSKLQSKFCSAFPRNCLRASKVCSFQGKSSLSCGNGCSPVPGLVQDLTQKWGSYSRLSTTYWYGGASLAVDGSAGFGNFSRRSCAHTLNQTNPFLFIDLHFLPLEITTVQLYNRLDCCSDRLNGVQVYVGSSWDAYNAPGNKKCVDPKFIFGPSSKGFPLNVTCNLPGPAVWVVVPGKKKILTICEVVIYGTYGSLT